MSEIRFHLGLDLLPIIPTEVGGMETYVDSFVAGFQQLGPEVKVTVFLNREGTGIMNLPDEWTCVYTSVPARYRSARYAYQQLVLPARIVASDIDVLFCPGYVGPLVSPVPTVITMHDANYEAIPESFSFARRKVVSTVYPRSAHNATTVLTVSEFSKGDLVRYLNVDPAKITVVHNPLPPSLPAPEAQTHDWIEGDYLFTAGKDYPHKNIDLLLRSLPSLPSDLNLIVAGFEADADHQYARLSRHLDVADRVKFAGYVSRERLATLYANSTAYVHPSKYEGFGFPVLEAMHYRTPVICSTAGAIPEIAGDAALFFDPRSTTELCERVRSVREDPTLRTRLIADGLTRSSEFSCERFTATILDSCERAATG